MTKPKTILIAVHGEAIRQQLHDFLKSFGLQPFKAENGVDALAAVMNYRPDGAILTVQLPKIDGVRVAQLLRDAEELRPVRLLLLGPQEVDARTLERLAPVVYCASAELDRVRAALVQLELLPDVSLVGEATEPLPAGVADEAAADVLSKPIGLLDAGDVDRAFDLLRAHVQSSPADLRARGYLDLCRTLLFRSALAELDNLQLRPRKILSDKQIMGMGLHSDEGFLLSYIDGVTRLRELFYLGGFDRPTTYILVRSLLHRGAIALK